MRTDKTNSVLSICQNSGHFYPPDAKGQTSELYRVIQSQSTRFEEAVVVLFWNIKDKHHFSFSDYLPFRSDDVFTFMFCITVIVIDSRCTGNRHGSQ